MSLLATSVKGCISVSTVGIVVVILASVSSAGIDISNFIFSFSDVSHTYSTILYSNILTINLFKVPQNGFDLTGTNSLIFQHRMGKRDSLTQDDTAIEGNNLSGLDVHKMVSSREGIDKRESFEVPMDTNNNERIKRSSHSGYVRFGKRFSPLIEGLQGHHNIER